MSERYSRLFSLPENLYASDSPVIISAGALLKDNQTGSIIAQLKLRNITSKTIKAAKVEILPLDVAGNTLDTPIHYQYLDFKAERENSFGAKSPIVLSDPTVRAFHVKVCEVIFADNTIWKGTEGIWESLSQPIPLSSLQSYELEKQFRLTYGSNCKNMLTEHEDLWYCVCGALNKQEEKICHACKRALDTLQAFDLDSLSHEKDARVKAEKEKAEQEAIAAKAKAAQEAAAEAKAKKFKKIAMIITPIIIVAIVAAVIVSSTIKKNREEAIRLDAYNTAIAYFKAGEYDKAITEFSALGDYKDSAEQVEKAKEAILLADYNFAVQLLESNQYNQAISAFSKLGDFKDSKDLLASATKMAEEKCIELINSAISEFFEKYNVEKANEQLDEAALIATDALMETIESLRGEIDEAYFPETKIYGLHHFMAVKSIAWTGTTTEEDYSTEYQYFFPDNPKAIFAECDAYISNYLDVYLRKEEYPTADGETIPVWFDNNGNAITIWKADTVFYVGNQYFGSSSERCAVLVYTLSATDVSQFIANDVGYKYIANHYTE